MNYEEVKKLKEEYENARAAVAKADAEEGRCYWRWQYAEAAYDKAIRAEIEKQGFKVNS